MCEVVRSPAGVIYASFVRLAGVDLVKWPDRPHRRVDGLRLGEDAYGVWIGVPSVSQPVTKDSAKSIPYVCVIPRDQWWMGRHFADGGWKLDVTTRPEWTDDRATLADLDLDVRRLHGEVWIEDEEEFETSLRKGWTPVEFAGPARRTADELYDALGAGREPFRSVGAQWLGMLLGVRR